MSTLNKIKAFENEDQTAELGNLTIENRTDRISIFGDIDITKDAIGLKNALELKIFLDTVIAKLNFEHDNNNLPKKIKEEKLKTINNPF